MTHKEKIQRLAKMIQTQTFARLDNYYSNSDLATHDSQVTVKSGRKYTKIDVGQSGKYMIDAQGNIFGIKAYGVIHHGHRYGTLDTIDCYDWSNYEAVKIRNEIKVMN